jgi:hypothetical protein
MFLLPNAGEPERRWAMPLDSRRNLIAAKNNRGEIEERCNSIPSSPGMLEKIFDDGAGDVRA